MIRACINFGVLNSCSVHTDFLQYSTVHFLVSQGNGSGMGQFNHQLPGPNGGPPPRGPAPNPPFQGGDGTFMQYQQGYPPQPGEPRGQWGQQGPPPQGGNFYGDQFYQGRGGPPLRRGRGFGMRGRGRGFGFGSWRGRGNYKEFDIHPWP